MNPFTINKINNSLRDYTVIAQDLDNWLIYRDGNGQLVGWINQADNKFEVCKLNDLKRNRFIIMRGSYAFSDYQQAINFIIGGTK